MATNIAVVTGRLTRDVDVRYTGSGIAVGNLSLAVERNFKNANGEYETDFINGVIWRESAERLASFTTKGSLITIQGSIQSGSYENKDGQKINTTEINVESFQLLESREITDERRERNKGGSVTSNYGQTNTSNYQNNARTSKKTASAGNPFENVDFSAENPFAGNDDVTNISDDDLPF